MAFRVGENVGPYRVVEQLGQGGMASVYKAYHAALDRYVAIKVLHPAFTEDPNFLARFQREARVIARLEHPNIVPVYDFAEHDGRPYLVMKFIEGETLKARLAGTTLADNDALDIVAAVGAGLAYAHERGVLHRDIKPSNVLLAEDGSIYLADFGLARIAQAGESTLSSDMMLGTPQYISPEQARGERDLDAGTDIYSFGVVLYELVVGRVPFSADTPFSIIHDHIYTPLPMPRQINPRVPEPIQRVLLKALAKERGDRFQSVEELVQAFRQGVEEAGGGAAAQPDLAPTRAVQSARDSTPELEADPEASPKRPGRRRWWLAGAALLVACLCLGALLILAGERGDRGPEAASGPEQTREVDEVPPPGSDANPDGTNPNRPVQAARATLEASPDDPEAHLNLARALFEQGFSRQALEEAMVAGELYLARGQAVEAAEALTRALEIAGGPEAADPRLLDLTTQALFIAAEQPERAGPSLELMLDLYPEWPGLPPIIARGMFYLGQGEQAVPVLLEVLEFVPDSPLALAVLAEIELASGNIEEGRGLAESALENPRTPPWLRGHLEDLLGGI